MRIWPDPLPTASYPGYGLSPIDPVIRTDFQRGDPRVRLATKTRRDRVSLQWIFTDAEMAAFRSWFHDEPVSLAGDADSLAAWTLSGLTLSADTGLGPDNALPDQLTETATTALHQVSLALPAAAFDATQLLARVTVKDLGRTKLRWGFVDRAGAFVGADINLTTDTVTTTYGGAVVTLEDRDGGWLRITVTGSTGTGTGDPTLRLRCIADDGSTTYLGDTAAKLRVCEVQARLVTGFDLFVRAGADGAAQGAAGGSAWVWMKMPVGGGFDWRECRFNGPYSARGGKGLTWDVTAEVTVRNA